jgi:glutathione S-transferase
VKLFHSRGTRSSRVHWFLGEYGIPFEVVPVDFLTGQHQEPAHRARHPHGGLPVLELDDGRRLIESTAIITTLAEERGLAPAIGSPARARWNEWMHYASATLDAILEELFLKQGVPRATRMWDEAARHISANLSPWIMGADFSPVDVAVGWSVNFARFLKLIEPYPALVEYRERCAARPAFKAAYAKGA